MTTPIKEIKPDLEEGGVTKTLAKFSSEIDEFVNYGTHILKYLVENLGGGDENVPILFFFRDLLEKADSISSLVNRSSIDPSKIILRSVFETCLQIEYLLEGDAEKKGLAFMVWNMHKQINTLESYQDGHKKNKRIKKAFIADKSFTGKSLFDRLPDTKVEVEELKNSLTIKEYNGVNKEYHRTWKKSGKAWPPHWYQLYNGPISIKDLASKRGKPYVYEVLYSTWSNNVHGTDILEGKILENTFSDVRDGKVAFDVAQLNLPTDAQWISAHCLEFLLESYTLVVNNLIPDKVVDLQQWFLSVKDSFQRITQGEQLIIVD